MRRRLIARVRHEYPAGDHLQDGQRPTLICTAALHGNEPSGVTACQRVADGLRACAPGAFRGEFIAFIGNVRALERGVRYIHEDLNRYWTPSRFRRAHELAAQNAERDDADSLSLMLAEDRELVELTLAVRSALDRAHAASVTLLDMHTTSADSPPFLAVDDAAASRRLARRLPIPAVIGLEEHLRGLFMSWFVSPLAGASGAAVRAAAVFEAGAHDDPDSVARHEAAIWLNLDQLGTLDPDADDRLRERLTTASRTLAACRTAAPSMMRLIHRHPVAEGSRFRMNDGWTNFQPVTAGEVVARDKTGDIAAPATGLMFMPLYQDQGEDGFLIVKPMLPKSSWASRLARGMHIGCVARVLPSVRRGRAPNAGDAFGSSGRRTDRR